jgi:hypothetical protein
MHILGQFYEVLKHWWIFGIHEGPATKPLRYWGAIVFGNKFSQGKNICTYCLKKLGKIYVNGKIPWIHVLEDLSFVKMIIVS